LVDEKLTGGAGEVSEQEKLHDSIGDENAASGSPRPSLKQLIINESRRDRRNVLRFLRTVGNWIKSFFGWADAHDGAITALATVAIVGLTYFYVTYSKEQWKEMQSARRPWLGMSERLTIKGPPSLAFTEMPSMFSGGQSTRAISVAFDVSGTLKNFGISPARREYDTFELIYLGSILNIFREEDCVRAENVSRGKSSGDAVVQGTSIGSPARAIFPSVELPVEKKLTTPIAMNPDFLRPIPDNPLLVGPSENQAQTKWTDRIPTKIWIVGCIAYQDTFGEMHHTKVLYQSSISDNPLKIAEDADPSKTRIPFTDFVMEDSESD